MECFYELLKNCGDKLDLNIICVMMKELNITKADVLTMLSDSSFDASIDLNFRNRIISHFTNV